MPEVHPRSRGEYYLVFRSDLLRVGSPPLTRGIQKREMQSGVAVRFTPAHAGNTALGVLFGSMTKVHPRSRGEYCHPRLQKLATEGSPPLTRGIRGQHFGFDISTGFTPAHAGNTIAMPLLSPGCKVHPRSRGEYICNYLRQRKEWGSPPLTRGIHPDLSDYEKQEGFTPAHAGNTRRR